jgi:archaellum component FlaF (FlaF/FlaG flagellin family)
MQRFIFILSLFFFNTSIAQDLTGTWEGRGGNTEYAKICIIRYKDTYIGYTYDVGMGHCKANLLARYDPKTKKFKGINTGMIEKTFLHGQSRYHLNYVVINGQEYLKGTASAKSVGATLMSFGLPFFITYTRISDKTDTTAYMQDWLTKNIPAQQAMDTIAMADSSPVDKSIADITVPVPVKSPAVADSIISDKNKRVTDTISVINTSERELLVKVMDNGVVDGDIVSIIHNGKVIAERIAVSETPYEFKIPIDSLNQQQEIILVAHNVGSISPNTALIVIDTPSKQYRLTASTDLSKNAMIIFKYKE